MNKTTNQMLQLEKENYLIFYIDIFQSLESFYLFYLFKHSGLIIGAKISDYLLEMSRIVSQVNDERNYHVFYELLAGLSEDEKLKYGLLDANNYFYLNQVRL